MKLSGPDTMAPHGQFLCDGCSSPKPTDAEASAGWIATANGHDYCPDCWDPAPYGVTWPLVPRS